MRATLRQLEIFIAIAEQGSVVAAANQLCLTQAAASAALAELENSLGVQLFVRKGRRLVIGPHGEWMLPRAKQLLGDAGMLWDGVKALDPMAGELHIGASQTVAEYLLPELIRRFNQRYPMVRIRVTLHNSLQLQQLVEQGQLDVGMVEGDIASARVSQQFWQEDELVIVAGPAHPLAGRSATCEALAKQRWVMREAGSGTRAEFERALQKSAIRLDIAQQISHTPSLVALVETGNYLGCFSRHVVEDALQKNQLAEVQSELVLSRSLSLLYSSSGSLSPKALAWLALANSPD